MSNNPATFGSSMADDANASVRDLSERARNAAASMSEVASDGLHTAASALHDRAGDLPGGETVRNIARATADGLGASADYVRSHNAKRMMADVETFVKSNPGPALAAAAAFGFLLGRTLSRD